MPKTYKIDIITPERVFFSGDVESIVFDTPDGKRGIMADHTPMIVSMAIGQIDIKVDGKWKIAFSSEGFIEITPDGVTMMAQSVEWPDEIDARRAEEAEKRAQERLRQKQSLNEYHSTMSSLARAMSRLRIKRNINID